MSRVIDVERLWRGWMRSPFHAFLAMELERWDQEAGEATFRLPFKSDYKRSTATVGIHGGIIASFIDVAADFTLAIHSNKISLPTIDLRIDYLRMASDGDLVAVARTMKTGRTIGIADVEVTDARDRVCAIGRGTYAMMES